MSFEYSRLDEIADVIDSLHKTPKYSENGYSMVRATDVKYGYLNLENTLKVDELTFNEFSRRYKPNKNDIVITRVGSYGITSLVNDTKFCLGQNTSVIIPKINSRYLYSVLNSSLIKHQIEGSVVGSTQKTLSLKSINALEIPRFGKNIEKKIANILSTLDDKIELNRKINKTLESMAQALFQSWFVDFDPVHAKAGCKSEADLTNAAKTLGISKETLELFPSEFEESEMGMIPKGWEVSNLGSVLTQRNESVKASKYTEQLPYVPIDCIDSKSLFLSTMKRGSEAKSSLISFYQYDIIFGAMRPYFHKVCIAPFNGTTRTTAFVLKSANEIDYSFGVLSAYQDRTIKYATSHSSGTTMPYVKWKGVLESMKIVNPSTSIKSEFNKIIKPMLEAIQGKFIQQTTLQKTRDTLLPKLLSGELDVSEIKLEKEE